MENELSDSQRVQAFFEQGRDHDIVGYPRELDRCPLATYLERTTGKAWKVGNDYYYETNVVSPLDKELPLYAEIFVKIADDNADPITYKEARSYLATAIAQAEKDEAELAQMHEGRNDHE